jgi:hypothetical protein
VAKTLAGSGLSSWLEEAHICAGQALTAVARSRSALQGWPQRDSECAELERLLDSIAEGLRREFPRVEPQACGQPWSGATREGSLRCGSP